VPLQGAGRRVAGADTNDYPAGVQRTGRPDRIRRFVARTCPCVRGNPAASCVVDFVRRIKGRSSHRVQIEFPDLRKRYWGGISGLGATSPPRAATSRTMSYFSIFRSTNLPASAGRYSVRYAEIIRNPLNALPAGLDQPAMSHLMLKSAKRASLIENLRSLRGFDKMLVR
jgi:hypothetical protein